MQYSVIIFSQVTIIYDIKYGIYYFVLGGNFLFDILTVNIE